MPALTALLGPELRALITGAGTILSLEREVDEPAFSAKMFFHPAGPRALDPILAIDRLR